MPSHSIDSIVHTAIRARIFPGAVVYAERNGEVVHHAAYGNTMYADPGSQPVQTDTCYDIASLTKPFTAIAALILMDAGHLGLDDPAVRFLPTLRADEVRIRHLLTHSSGLDIRLSTLRELDPAAIRANIYALEPRHPPGQYTLYANISSLLLGDIVAAVYGATLDKAIQELILDPLAMNDTGYCPAPSQYPRIAPTEWDNAWRGGLVHGVVHDESAYALGGIAGHAGLFSTSSDLAHLAHLWLQGGTWAGRQILREATVALASRDHTGHMQTINNIPLAGGLGWARDRQNFMGRSPTGSIGHTGFTGSVIVMIPAAQATLIVLNNRTYPQRTPPPYRHHAVVAAMVEALLDA